MKRFIFGLLLTLAVPALLTSAAQPPMGFWRQVTDTVAPALSGPPVIDTNGTTWTFPITENATATDWSGWAATMSKAGAITFTYVSGTGTSSLVYSGSPTVLAAETVTVGLNYTYPTNGIQDTAGNHLADISGASVTNNSTASAYLLSDNLDYADSTAAVAAGWDNTSTPVWHYTTAPAPIPDNSLYASSLAYNSSGDLAKKNFTATGEVWAFFVYYFNDFGLHPEVLCLMNAANSKYLIKFEVSGTKVVTLECGTANTATGTNAVTNATVYYIWVHYKKGTGTDGLADLWISTTTTRGSPLLSITTGSSNEDAATIMPMQGVAGLSIFNKMRVSASAIGDNPS